MLVSVTTTSTCYPRKRHRFFIALEMFHLGTDEMAREFWQQRQHIGVADEGYFRNLAVMVANEFEMRDCAVEILPSAEFPSNNHQAIKRTMSLDISIRIY